MTASRRSCEGSCCHLCAKDEGFMWQDELIAVARSVSACPNRVNPLFQGNQHLTISVWLRM